MSESDSTYDPNECVKADIANVHDLSDFDSDATYDPNDEDEKKNTQSNQTAISPPKKSNTVLVTSKSCQNNDNKTNKSKIHDISDSDSDTVPVCVRKSSQSLFADSDDSDNNFCFGPSLNTSKSKIVDNISGSPLKKSTENITKSPSKLDFKQKIKKDDSVSKKLSLDKSDTIELITEKKVSVINSKSPCRYGSKCYRKNPSHFEEYAHPKDIDLKRKLSSDDNTKDNKKIKIDYSASPSTSKPTGAGTPSFKKHQVHSYQTDKDLVGVQIVNHGKPYSFFLTKVSGIRPVHNGSLSVSLKDILHPSMGKIIKSAQFNFMFEIPWIMQQYPPEFRKCPLLLIHGFTRGNKAALDMDASVYDNIRLCQARLDIMYGTHHTKMMLLHYDEGMRVVISTANLIQSDWHQKTQGVWISPMFPKIASSGASSSGDSATNFKRDLIQYLNAYKARQVNEWVDIIRGHDMSQAKVHIIGSTPGRHTGELKHAFGHLKLRKVMDNYGPDSSKMKGWPVIGQFSSIGSLGPSEDNWLCGEFYTSLSSCKDGGTSMGGNITKLKLIYPSKDNVRTSLEGYPAGGSLPYSINTAKKQLYLHKFFHQWRSEVRGRSRASPHIKTYCRLAPEHDRMAWFLVTSANLSKAAWGALEKKGSQLMIRSYEIGVLLLPENYNDNGEYFPVLQSGGKGSSNTDLPAFPQPYDFPLTPYTSKDKPWIMDVAYTDLPDSHGNAWCPQ